MSGVVVIVMVVTVLMTVMTIAAAFMIIITSIFMMSRAGNSFGFFSIDISIRHLYQLTDGGGPLVV